MSRSSKEEKTKESTPKIQKFAAGGVGKIRHEQSDKSGKPISPKK